MTKVEDVLCDIIIEIRCERDELKCKNAQWSDLVRTLEHALMVSDVDRRYAHLYKCESPKEQTI